MRQLICATLFICLSCVLANGSEEAILLHVGASVAYSGPCDVVSCAAAYSVTRSMRSAYAGNLFQLYNGTTTLDVGQSNHVVNTSGVAAFCKGVLNGCVYSKIYDQSGNGADFVPVTSALSPTNAPATCTNGTGNVCAAPFAIDPNTRLPIVATVYPSEYDVVAPAVNGGAHPTSIFFYGRNDMYPSEFGIGHAPNASLINGTDFIILPSVTDHQVLTNYDKCSAATAACLAIDEETSVEPYNAGTAPNGIGVTYATGTSGDVSFLITWDGTSTVKAYANSSTALFTDSPPSSVQYNSSALVPGNHMKLGCGGDCTQSQGLFREGFVSNATLSSADYASVASNVSSFYSGHSSTPACMGVGDLSYYIPNSAFPTDFLTYAPMSSGFLAYSLAQVRSNYFGPVADLNNGTSTQTFSSAQAAGSTGCGLDPAAVTFCSGGCTVAKLYNQGTLSTAHVGNVHDTALDIVFSSGQQPGVTFNSLNGLPTMNFTGSQHGCSGVPSNGFVTYLALSAVARRTGSTTSFANLLDFNPTGSQIQIGFNNSANNVFSFIAGTVHTQAATDTHWHSIYIEDQNTTQAPYVDGVAGTTFAGSAGSVTANSFCIGGKSDGSQSLTGDIAEIDASSINSYAAAGYTSQAANAFSKMEGLWGTLPN